MIDTLRNLPDSPGVYQYFDREGRLLYVGKAKSLKKRIKSYFRFTPRLAPAPNLSPRIYHMVSQIDRLEVILTPTESDALVLENSLIKQLKPKYNILLRDDKTYPYIYLDLKEPFPRLEITRKVIKGKKVRYFGPFPHGARALLDSIYELVPLVQKKGSLKGKKACLFHQIGRCEAPCEGKITPEAYARHLQEALGYLHNQKQLIAALQKRMHRYAQQLRFEEAARLRDRMEAIGRIEQNAADLARREDLDLFAFADNGQRGVLVRLFIREGKVVASSHTYIEAGADPAEVYRQALLDFYTEETPFTASEILTAHPLEGAEELAHIVGERIGRRVHLRHPLRGDKKRLIGLALQNADELLRQKSAQEEPLAPIRRLLDESAPIRRVEAFDNSHTAGEEPVGAMVVYDNGKWDKSSYRRYRLQAKDEYRQMEEMLQRRISDFDKEPPPDLWVIDGGETLRRLALGLLKKAGVTLPVAAIAKEKVDAKAHRAKGSAKDLLYIGGEPLRLPPSDTRLQWFQKLRDEAHRFAITYHRKKRLEREKQISLLEVEGIGPGRVKKLLDYFGSFEAVRQADIQALKKVIGPKAASALYKHLKKVENHKQT